ncbi:MAG: uracil-DNA glycosylase [Betaproteobacteria bacterium]
MSLNLDARQRAMLLEMGVRVWWPRAPAAAKVAGPLARVVREPHPTAPAPSPALSQTDGAVEHMDWAQLAQAVQDCTACGLCEGRKAPVFVSEPAPLQADWLVVGEPPDEHEERAGSPFVGAAGQLLDNMLRAVSCQRDGHGRGGARLTHVVKCRPAAVRPPLPDELARCAVFLRREIALTRPRVILAMGRFAALSLLAEDYPEVLQMPLGQLRGREFRVDGIPVIVTYHPVKLLRAPLEKANAWADLCLARSLVQNQPSHPGNAP